MTRKSSLAKRILANPVYVPQFGHKETLQGQLSVLPLNSPQYEIVQMALEKIGDYPKRTKREEKKKEEKRRFSKRSYTSL